MGNDAILNEKIAKITENEANWQTCMTKKIFLQNLLVM